MDLGFFRNPYVGRSFISPSQELRDLKVPRINKYSRSLQQHDETRYEIASCTQAFRCLLATFAWVMTLNSQVLCKFNPMEHVLKGKTVIVIDDSIVRGTTAKQLVSRAKGVLWSCWCHSERIMTRFTKLLHAQRLTMRLLHCHATIREGQAFPCLVSLRQHTKQTSTPCVQVFHYEMKHPV